MAKAELNKKTSELVVKTVADKKVWKDTQDKAFTTIAENTTVKGFRKGKAPMDVLKKQISRSDIFGKAVTEMLDILVKEAAKEIKDDILVLDAPTYSVDKISDAELEISFIYPVYPEIKLPDYKKLGVKYEEKKVEDKDVDEEIKKISASRATLKDKKDGAIEKGDTAIFDFVGMVDGKEFEGGKAEKYSLEIGSGNFIPGFEDQMIGLKIGDEKDVKVSFPKEYHSEDLKGKDAVFKVKIHEIKSKEEPKVDDEFVKSLGVPNTETLKELKEYIKRVNQEQVTQTERQRFQREAFDKIIEQVEIVIPSQLVVKEMKNQEQRFMNQLKQYGQTMEQYITMTGIKPEEMNSQFKKGAEAALKDSLIFAEIAKLEKIELKDEDYDQEYEKLAKVYGQDAKSLKNVVTKPQMQIPMTNDRVISALIKYNN